MTSITYHVTVDQGAGTATVTSTPADAKFVAGDEVSFTSNVAGTVIKYTDGSPFTEDVTGRELKLPQGPFKMKDTKDSFHCSCGRLISGTFSPWEGGTVTTGGGHPS